MRKVGLLLLLLINLFSIEALAGVDFYPLEQLKVGQKGIGKTVIRGVKVETFDVEIIDVLPNAGFDGGPLILARFSGPVVEMSNGIAAGYSGSPVYIDGKLLGAVSTAVPFSDTHIGGITPITSMLSALPRRGKVDYSGNTVIPEPKTKRKSGFLLLPGSSNDENPLPPSESPQDLSQQFNKNNTSLQLKPLAAPLIVRSANQKSIELLREALKDNPFVEVVGGAPGGSFQGKGLLYDPAKDTPLKPGDALAVSLVHGDIELSAVGTVTYVDEMGQVLAFGHPFLLSGDTSLSMGKAYIAYTNKSVERAYKDGFRLNSVGAITSDRLSAVGGLIGEKADLLPIKVVVNDIDLRRSREFNAEVVREPFLSDILIGFVVSEAFTRVVDMAKGGTTRLEFYINGIGLKEPVKRTNYFYDEISPVNILWDEALPFASLLTNNIYREVKITEFNIKIDFTRNRVNASIDDAKIVTEKDKAKEAEKKEAEQGQGEQVEEAKEGTEEKSPEEQKENESEGEGEEEDQIEGIGSPLQAPLQQMVEPPPPQEGEMGGYPYAEPPKTVYPGETLEIEVRLQPFRQEPIFEKIYVTIPEDFPIGMTNLYIRGGGSLVSLLNEFGGKGKMLFGSGAFVNVDSTLHDLDKIIEKALATPLNNEVVVSIMKPMEPPQPNQDKKNDEKSEEEKEEREFKISVPTKWVIYNMKVIPINIQPKEATKQKTSGQGGINPK